MVHLWVASAELGTEVFFIQELHHLAVEPDEVLPDLAEEGSAFIALLGRGRDLSEKPQLVQEPD